MSMPWSPRFPPLALGARSRIDRAQVAAYPLQRLTRFSRAAWDFRGYEDRSG
jgi:hypothetical protein